MKRVFLTFAIICIFLTGTTHGQGHWRPGEMEVRVELTNARDADKLSAFNFNGDIYKQAGYALLFITREELETIRSAGFSAEILQNDLNSFSANFWETRDAYHSYEEIIAVANQLSTDYPEICKKYIYGNSVEGRELAALKISDNVNDDEHEAEIMFDGGIHGDEIGGPENLVRFAEYLCTGYVSDPYISSLVDNREIWIYLMVNPDGRVNMSRYNSNGVDMNRDFGYMWNADGSSPAAYSQPETRALRNCMLDNQFVVNTSYHSGTEYLAYTWSYRPDPTPDHYHDNLLAGIYAANSGYANLQYGQGYTGMYPINGCSKDAAYAGMGSIGWTMEISVDKQPAPSQIQHFFDINKSAMVKVIEYSGYGLQGTVTDATTGEPVAAVMFINDFYPCFADPEHGDYHKFLETGTYSVTATANGYQSMTQTVTVEDSTSATLDFTLQPQYGHYAYRVISCQVPVDNFYDEAFTPAAFGEPDNVSYSLGRSGWIILDMLQPALDGPGDDIIVHEGGNDPESFTCYASPGIDGPWILVGGGTSTTAFDFAPAGILEARYIKIVDYGEGPVTGDDAGFDLDAIEVPEQQQVIFLVVDCEIEDPLGNGDGRIDPGENFDLVITLRNQGGMTLENGHAWLNFNPQFLSLNNPDVTIDSLAFGDAVQVVFHMGCSSFCPNEEILMTVFNIISNDGVYQESFPLNFRAGAIVEDWETGNLLKYDWTAGGNKPWAIFFQNPYEGSFSAKSGNIDDNEVSSLEITLDVIGYDDISFYSRVSSESGADFLKFYIDNNLLNQWSGELSWQFSSYQVKPGIHTFKWSYMKDGLTTVGSDGGWLDYIVFPSCNLDGSMQALANAIPRDICGSGESQLNAYVVGGSGNYSYSWTPSSSLNDTTLQDPIATPEVTTVYSVTVDDGTYSIASEALVNVYPLPDAPVIQQVGDSLVSSSLQGNQWHNLAGPISGETGKVFHPETEGYYFDIITGESGCSSDSSNLIDFHFMGVDEISQEMILIYPNPFSDYVNIRFTGKIHGELMLKIIDITGRVILSSSISSADQNEIISIPTKGLRNGLTLLHISDQDGKTLVSKKLIKL